MAKMSRDGVRWAHERRESRNSRLFGLKRKLIVILLLFWAGANQGAKAQQCDYFDSMDCPSVPDCVGDDCYLTPSVPTWAGGSGEHSGSAGNPISQSQLNAQYRKEAAQSVSNQANAEIINTTLLQPIPGLTTDVVIVDASGSYVQAVPNGGRLPVYQTNTTSRLPFAIPNTEPVAGDGEFTVDETDLTLPGNGIPFVFTRHYRSGVDYQTSLGFGWNHTFNQRLVLAPLASRATNPMAYLGQVILINDRLEQLRFSYDHRSTAGDDVYLLQAPGTMTLKRAHGDPSANWRLDDGSDLIYSFDPVHQDLISISDAAGHEIRVAWRQRTGAVLPTVDHVTDTTGRIINFVYEQLPETSFWPNQTEVGTELNQLNQFGSSGPVSFEHLACLSFTTSCGKGAILKFVVNPIIATSTPVTHIAQFKSLAYIAHTANYVVEFDLTSVLDPNGLGPTYKYYTQPRSDPLIYQKEFDQFWPSRYASQLYQLALQGIPASVAGCGSEVQALVKQVDSWVDTQLGAYALCEPNTHCETKAIAKLTKQCESQMPNSIKGLSSRIPKTYEYGVPPELYHNLIEIDDADGRPVVQNTYGTDTQSVAFDRVVSQTLASDASATTSFSYIDWTRRARPPQQSELFKPITICPTSSAGYGGIVIETGLDRDAFQNPALEIVATGPLGRTTRSYLDSSGRLIRSIDGLGVRRDANYASAGVSGLLGPAANRVCAEYDSSGRVLQTAELPAQGLPGNPIVTSFTYDGSEFLIGEAESENGTTLRSRTLVRDPVERIIGIGDAVDSSHIRWTCLEYTDTAEVAVVPVKPFVAAAGVPAAAAQPGGAGRQPVSPPPSLRSPCVLKAPPFIPLAFRAEFPSRIIRPDGTVVALSNFTPTGPGEIVTDATGTSPVDQYLGYDTYGRLNKVGLRDFSTKANVPGTEVTWETDLSGLIHTLNTADATNAAYTLTTTFTYDNARSLKTVQSPLFTRTFVSDALGDVTSVVDAPAHPTSTSDSVRSRCFTYNPYGQVSTAIIPEGEVEGYAYDLGGNLIEVSLGPQLGPTINGNSGVCTAITAPLPNLKSNSPSPREATEQYTYNTNGQMTGSVKGGVHASYSYDGLNRLMDTMVTTANSHATMPIHYSSGYSGSRLAWSIIADFSAGGKLPAYLTPGVQAGEEYNLRPCRSAYATERVAVHRLAESCRGHSAISTHQHRLR